MTPFQKKGWTKDTVLETTRKTRFPEGTRVRLSTDDRSAWPLFAPIDDALSVSGGSDEYVYLEHLREVKPPVEAQHPFKVGDHVACKESSRGLFVHTRPGVHCVVKAITGSFLSVSTLDDHAISCLVEAKHFQHIPAPDKARIQSTDDLIAENKSLQRQIGALEERLARKKEFFQNNKRIIAARVAAMYPEPGSADY